MESSKSQTVLFCKEGTATAGQEMDSDLGLQIIPPCLLYFV